MYVPDPFRQGERDVLLDLLRDEPLAELVTFGEGGLSSSALPMLFDETAGKRGALLGHLARANPQWRTADLSVEALAIFRGAQGYVSPSWYPTKAEHGRVVPTWNYVSVQVRGTLVLHDDDEWKLGLVSRLTTSQEGSRARPWAVGDAPEEFVRRQLGAIVGVELRVGEVGAKWKMSQNQPEVNRAGVVAGLEADGSPAALAVAALVARGGGSAADRSPPARIG